MLQVWLSCCCGEHELDAWLWLRRTLRPSPRSELLELMGCRRLRWVPSATRRATKGLLNSAVTHTSLATAPLLRPEIALTHTRETALEPSTPPWTLHSSRLHHVQKQLRQRLGYLLAPGPHLPGRICTRGSQAGFGCCRHCQQNTRGTRSNQGNPFN